MINLIANTLKVKNEEERKPNQFLDQHLYYVCRHALQVAQSLSRLSDEMDAAYDIKRLKKKSPSGFEWQDQAVKAIEHFRKEPSHSASNQAWFIVNMASTGKGETIANAKIMQALSAKGDSLRYILALGLRTLTLQTGDAYRQDIGLSDDELAILIGSKAIQELHQHSNNEYNDKTDEQFGSESQESLLDNELDYDNEPQTDFLNVLFPPNQPSIANRNKAFLYKPVLACTIDHITGSTETKRGGKYILPYLRLLSSDLVIDEVDDFSSQDLIAIARLGHLAGMLGRKVMINQSHQCG